MSYIEVSQAKIANMSYENNCLQVDRLEPAAGSSSYIYEM